MPLLEVGTREKTVGEGWVAALFMVLPSPCQPSALSPSKATAWGPAASPPCPCCLSQATGGVSQALIPGQ